MTNISITKGAFTFTFTDAMVPEINTNLKPEVFKVIMPGSGPASNTGNDFEGVEKTITITGNLLPSDTSVVTGVGAPVITTVKQMKYFLESLYDGSQQAMTFTSNNEQYSLISPSTTCIIDGVAGTIDGVAIPGNWSTTKVYCDAINFKEEVTPDFIPFSITFWVAGY